MKKKSTRKADGGIISRLRNSDSPMAGRIRDRIAGMAGDGKIRDRIDAFREKRKANRGMADGGLAEQYPVRAANRRKRIDARNSTWQSQNPDSGYAELYPNSAARQQQRAVDRNRMAEGGIAGKPANPGKSKGEGNENAAAGGGRGTGLPPGLAKRAALPPGLAKRTTLPRGLMAEPVAAMKAGGKVKSKRMASGGMVRGAGCASRGSKKAKVY